MTRCTRLVIALCAAGVAMSTSACGGDGESDPGKPQSSTSSSASSSPPTESADLDESAALAGYKASWDAQVEAYAQASSKDTELTKTTSLKALAKIESDLMAMKKNGRITVGKPSIAPEVTSVKQEKGRTVATVTDCVDISGWTLVDKETRKEVPLPEARLTQFENVATVEDWGKSGWLVTEVEQKGKC